MPNQVVYLKNITKVFEMCKWKHCLPSISKLVVPGLHWIEVGWVDKDALGGLPSEMVTRLIWEVNDTEVRVNIHTWC